MNSEGQTIYATLGILALALLFWIYKRLEHKP